MLAIGHGSVNDTYDGAPRVHLPDDAEDVADFLGALINPVTLPQDNPSDPAEPLKLLGIMKLVVKYEVDMLRTMIVRQLEHQWPTTLVEWEKQRHLRAGTERLANVGVEVSQGFLPASLDTDDWRCLPEPAFAVRFGMDFNCPSILPAAFYELAFTKSIDLWTTDSRERRPVRWELLKASETLALLRGVHALHSQLREDIIQLRGSVKDTCALGWSLVFEGDRSCSSFLDKLIRDHMQNSNIDVGPLETFRCFNNSLGLGIDWEDDSRMGWCCTSGYDAARENIRESAQDLWDFLPTAFGFESLPR